MARQQLYDNHGRLIDYVRLAVTDRCNLRCFYCMPEEGIDYVPRKQLMTYEEMERLMQVLVALGIEKIRITGGEPFIRKGIMEFITNLSKIENLKTINITTNGTTTLPYLKDLKRLGVNSINLSLDSLDRNRFFKITRRDAFDTVMQTLDDLVTLGFKTKINAVVMENQNIQDILPMVALTKDMPISVRFIEEMPFNGSGNNYPILKWNYQAILQHIQAAYPKLQKVPSEKTSTSINYIIPGHRGSIGLIPAFSRTFCGTCNRIRITPQGLLKTCLYDNGVFNIKDLMRAGANKEQLATALKEALNHRAKDGYEAERNRNFGNPIQESMSTIGG